ncbi:hypothetical protein PMAYCL1PPCAC_22574, partial [Pristionchus mayeri]
QNSNSRRVTDIQHWLTSGVFRDQPRYTPIGPDPDFDPDWSPQTDKKISVSHEALWGNTGTPTSTSQAHQHYRPPPNQPPTNVPYNESWINSTIAPSAPQGYDQYFPPAPQPTNIAVNDGSCGAIVH